MNSDGKTENNLDPNLDKKSSPCFLHSRENLQESALKHTYYMPPCESGSNRSFSQADTAYQEPTLVDGASCTKLNSSRTPSLSIRPHQVDAVHPFFNGYRSVKFDKTTSTDNQVFYCRQCKINIELCQEAVNQHFVAKQHLPIEENCVYCKTAVYEYFYNSNVCYYHRCPVEQNRGPATESSRDRLGLYSIKSPNEQEPVKSTSMEPTEKSKHEPC